MQREQQGELGFGYGQDSLKNAKQDDASKWFFPPAIGINHDRKKMDLKVLFDVFVWGSQGQGLVFWFFTAKLEYVGCMV